MEQRSSILVCDANSEEMMQLLSIMEERYKLIDVDNGTACLEKAETTLPDLILLDDMALEPNCYEVCTQLKQDAQTRDIPVVLMSDLPPHDLDEEITIVGADDYICKPFPADELLEKIDTLLMFRQCH